MKQHPNAQSFPNTTAFVALYLFSPDPSVVRICPPKAVVKVNEIVARHHFD